MLERMTARQKGSNRHDCYTGLCAVVGKLYTDCQTFYIGILYIAHYRCTGSMCM